MSHYTHQDNKDGAMSDSSTTSYDGSTTDRGKRIKIRIARAIPFLSLLCNLAFLHLLSDIQSDLRLSSTVEVGRILSHRPAPSTDRSSTGGSGGGVGGGAGSGPATDITGDSGENEWQAYLAALAAIRMCLWVSVAGNILGCYGVLKPSSRFVLLSLLQAHIELLFGLAATIPVLIMILLPSLFITIEPITPIICSEILSHPQAVRDLFEPLRMLTPYDEFAGCDAWVSGCAAPLGLFGVFAWGFTRWKINALLHFLYRHICRQESEADPECGLSSRYYSHLPRRGAIRLSSSDAEEESMSDQEKEEEQEPAQEQEQEKSGVEHRDIQGHGRRRSVKVDLVVPSRHLIRAAKQTQKPLLFAPVPRTRMQNMLRTIQVDLPH